MTEQEQNKKPSVALIADYVANKIKAECKIDLAGNTSILKQIEAEAEKVIESIFVANQTEAEVELSFLKPTFQNLNCTSLKLTADELKKFVKETAGKTKTKKSTFLSDVIQIAVFVIIALTFRSIILDHYVIPSGSMIPTLLEGDRVVVTKIAYGLRLPFTSVWLWQWDLPAKGDVIVFSSPVDGTTLIKRVAAVGGDTLEVKNGQLSINGNPVAVDNQGADYIETLNNKKHLMRLSAMGGPDIGPITVPEGSLFMLGDNRGNSQDSRYWGFLDKKLILGKATRIYYRSQDGFVWNPL